MAGALPGRPKNTQAIDCRQGFLLSCCSRLPLSSPSGKGGGAEGFGIGGADGGGLEKPSELTDGDTTTEPDLGVDGAVLDAGVFKSTRGDTDGALLDGRGAEGALLDAGVFQIHEGGHRRCPA